MKASDILEDAARIMSERGHAKGIYEDEEGKVCLFGAVFAAAGSPSMNMLDAVTPYIQGQMDPSWRLWPATWNDRPETSAEDVILVLKRAAEEARLAELLQDPEQDDQFRSRVYGSPSAPER